MTTTVEIASLYRPELVVEITALAEIPRRSRTLLRLQIIDQLTLEEMDKLWDEAKAAERA